MLREIDGCEGKAQITSRALSLMLALRGQIDQLLCSAQARGVARLGRRDSRVDRGP